VKRRGGERKGGSKKERECDTDLTNHIFCHRDLKNPIVCHKSRRRTELIRHDDCNGLRPTK